MYLCCEISDILDSSTAVDLISKCIHSPAPIKFEGHWLLKTFGNLVLLQCWTIANHIFNIT